MTDDLAADGLRRLQKLADDMSGPGLHAKSTDALRSRVSALEAAIREHRDQKADDRCWMDDQKLYAVLGDGNLGDNTVGDPADMIVNCARFIEQRCKGGGPWKSYAALEAERDRLLTELKEQHVAHLDAVRIVAAELAALKEAARPFEVMARLMTPGIDGQLSVDSKNSTHVEGWATAADVRALACLTGGTNG